MRYIPWTQDEIEVLRTAWTEGGMKNARRALPHRSETSLRGKATWLGLHVMGRKNYERYPVTPFVDAAIKRAYRSGPVNLAALSRATGRNVGWLKYRAGLLGVRNPSVVAGAMWLPEEDALLQRLMDEGRTISAMHRRFRYAGFRRSLNAIACRAYRLGHTFGGDAEWSATDVAKMFDVDVGVIRDWIGRGYLRATQHSGEFAAPDQAPTRWHIEPNAVRQFMISHPHRWNHRLMQKDILLHLLAPREFETYAYKEAMA
ncbi:MAG: hypothetical protein ABTR07_18170 [Candidatus Competibacter denitrificans]